MTLFPVSAPGKAFLIGEYAVLEGGPALVAALNVRAVAHVPRPEVGESSERPSPFVRAAHEVALGYIRSLGLGTFPPPPTVETQGFTTGPRKLGLGSSAAVVVATIGHCLAAAGLPIAETEARERIFELAVQAHRLAQSGIGSGGDIAASTFGGVLHTQLGKVRPVRFPEHIHCGFFDAGQPASTQSLVGQVRALKERDLASYQRAMLKLTAAAETMYQGLSSDDFSILTGAVIEHLAGLRQLQAASSAEIITPRIDTILAQAQALGLAAKPSGAGGGDIVVVFAQSPGQLDRLAATLMSKHQIARFEALRIDEQGLSREERAPLSSRLSGFFRKPVTERRQQISQVTGIPHAAFRDFDADHLGVEAAQHMVENVIGTLELPMAIATNFRINGRDFLVPMCVEEASVVAAASNAARMIRMGGGFQAASDPPWMIAQIQLVGRGDPAVAVAAIDLHRDELLAAADAIHPRLVARGGGARELEVRILDEENLVVHVLVSCLDAMGANLLNTIAEHLAPRLEALTHRHARLKILSNLADRRVSHVAAHVPVHALASDGWEGQDVARFIVQASRFAELDPYRATTHNKGIMNGADAVILATGNDWRAMEASAHAYAARTGKYAPLATWKLDTPETLIGTMAIPTAVGVVGGATRTHPAARLALRILGNPSAVVLGQVVAAAGLASNLAALRALATEGIQRGHMGLHARNVALGAGATGAEIEALAQSLVASGEIKADRATALLHELRRNPRQL